MVLSDHTIGSLDGTIAACLGAIAIEKHFTIDRKIKGPDSRFSTQPKEFNNLVNELDTVIESLGEKN